MKEKMLLDTFFALAQHPRSQCPKRAAYGLCAAALVLSWCGDALGLGPFIDNASPCAITIRIIDNCHPGGYTPTLAPGQVLDQGTQYQNDCGYDPSGPVTVYDLGGTQLGAISSVQVDSNGNSAQAIVIDGCDGTPMPINDKNDLSPADSCHKGMPVWSVSEPFVTLSLQDEPLWYQPALGPRVALGLVFKHREFTAGYTPTVFGFGRKWNCSWLSYVSLDSNTNAVVLLPGGGQLTFYGGSNYVTGARLTGSTTNGFTLTHPDGSSDAYLFIVTNSSGVFQQAFLSQHQNPQAQATRFTYASYDPTAPVVRLLYVIDSDGLTNTISYVAANLYSTNLISQVADPFGRTVSLAYDHFGHLTNLTDVAGISTAFTYDANEVPLSMQTPYGTTSFSVTETVTGQTLPSGRSILVTDPDGVNELFLYQDSANGISSSYASSQVPVTTNFSNGFENTHLDLRNTFHWGRQQYAALSTTTIASFKTNDFRIASMRHWLLSAPATVGETISLSRLPSPDSGGFTEGQKTWYDYAGKTNNSYEGTQILPLFVAQVLPDGTTRFTRTDRNGLGLVTTSIDTYSAGGSIALRTNILTYSTNSIDLLTVTNAIGVQTTSNAYNGYHQVLTNYNALGEMTVFNYNGNLQLASVALPTGLVTTNVYFISGSSSNHLNQTIDYAIVGALTNYYRTNSYTWTNDLVLTRTDPLGLLVSNTWDNLQRIVRVDYPDATAIINTYTNLDLIQTIDRMGFTTSHGYNKIRQLVAFTNANAAVSRYGYCSCGSLEAVTNGFGTSVQSVTSYSWDLQGNMVQSVGPDGYTLTYNYNALTQLTNTTDGPTSTTNWFNNQGLQIASSNAFGQVSAAIYDALDRATNTVDANGVSVSSSYDNLNRILSRAFPDNGVEHFAYTRNIASVTSYTNQLNTNVLNYTYDPLGRKTAEVYPGISTNKFTYDGANNLLILTDGKSQVTTWHYDQFGRVTNKVDAASNVVFTYGYDPGNRLTNRTSAAKGTTTYKFDPVGNLTNVVYPVNTNLVLGYDALNRLTSMVDAVGRTTYGYDAAGQLLSEDGPWADDTVSYGYNNRLRTSLSVLAPNASPWTQSYGYDAARRLQTLTSPAGSFSYTYDATRNLQEGKLTLPSGAYITNSYDSVARLLSTQLKNGSGGILNSHSYVYDPASQRTQQVFTATNYVNYTYDGSGQLLTALGKESSGTNRLLEQFGYAYDAGGNLNFRTNNALLQTFNVNNLNEPSTITRSGTLTVEGTTTSPATNVTVNTSNAVLYSDSTFAAAGFILTNGNNGYTTIAKDSYGRQDTSSVTVNLLATNTYTYDLNGNLTSDGKRGFDYDDENQLIRITVTNGWKSEFVYDGKFRRRIRREYTWVSSSWRQTNEVHYLYDGSLAIQERDANNLSKLSYTRGPDLSGTLQGAGGIGGLLALSQLSTINPQHYCYHADGNGNVTCLINASQAIVAKYLYGPCGNFLSQSGSLADANLYRFSSKEFHLNSGLTYYGYRFYDPNLQKWLSRDPIGIRSGANLYRFCSNDAVDDDDPFGLTNQPGDFGWDNYSVVFPAKPIPIDTSFLHFTWPPTVSPNISLSSSSADLGSIGQAGPRTLLAPILLGPCDHFDSFNAWVPTYMWGTAEGDQWAYFTAKQALDTASLMALPSILPEILPFNLLSKGIAAETKTAWTFNLAEGEASLVLMKDGQLVAKQAVGSMLTHAEFAAQNGAVAADGSLAQGYWIGTVGKVNGQVVALNSSTFYGNQLPSADATFALRSTFH
jgi:RHS repeat-associated protein